MTKWIVKKRSQKEIVDQLLVNRGVELDSREKFLNPQYQDLADPFKLKDIDKAVEKIKKADKIMIFGDYDVDGVTATIVLKEGLKALRPNLAVDIYLPDRNQEGYGLNKKAVREISQQGFDLIITVDCGMSDAQEIALANKLGLEVIVTDHHCIGSKPVPAYAVINPRQEKDEFPFEKLAGVGVAWQVARVLFRLAGQEEQAKWLLDLVALGTVADCMPLLSENRILTKYGLLVLKKTPRKGLQELINSVKGRSANLSTETISWRLAPRLNAASRMDHANSAYKLLISDSSEEAQEISRHLEQLNRQRRQLTNKIVEQIESQIDLSQKLIFIEGAQEESWPIGVLGLVAGKISRHYWRPVIVLSKGKASARSIPGFNIMDSLTKCREFFIEYGGHAQAAGFQIEEDKIAKVKQKIELIAQKELSKDALKKPIKIEAEIDISDINWQLYDQIERLAPFGKGNPKPNFLLKGVKMSKLRCVGQNGQHLKFKLSSGHQVIGFNQGGLRSHLRESDAIDLVFTLQKNTWNGQQRLQLQSLDLRNSREKSS